MGSVGAVVEILLGAVAGVIVGIILVAFYAVYDKIIAFISNFRQLVITVVTALFVCSIGVGSVLAVLEKHPIEKIFAFWPGRGLVVGSIAGLLIMTTCITVNEKYRSLGIWNRGVLVIVLMGVVSSLCSSLGVIYGAIAIVVIAIKIPVFKERE